MTAADYRAARELRGSQTQVAKLLGVTWRTIQRREAGDVPVTEEAARALLSLRKKSASD